MKGPRSQLYSHILTSCFLDTILVPLCTWLYIFTLLFLLFLSISTQRTHVKDDAQTGIMGHQRTRVAKNEDVQYGEDAPGFTATPFTEPKKTTAMMIHTGRKWRVVLQTLYYLLLLAQSLMCALEIARLSLADLGIGLLPFTFVTLIVAGLTRFTSGLGGRVIGWRWVNVGVWVALAVCDGVKIAEEVKEGVGMREGSKYPEKDEVTDVAVMVGVYVVLAVLEVGLGG